MTLALGLLFFCRMISGPPWWYRVMDKNQPVFLSIEDSKYFDHIPKSICRNAFLELQGNSTMLHCFTPSSHCQSKLFKIFSYEFRTAAIFYRNPVLFLPRWVSQLCSHIETKAELLPSRPRLITFQTISPECPTSFCQSWADGTAGNLSILIESQLN